MKKMTYPSHQAILYLKGIENYTELHLTDGKKVMSSYTLIRHQEVLNGFIRVSKSYLLNPNYIKKIYTHSGHKEVELVNGEYITVSRRRKKTLKQISVK